MAAPMPTTGGSARFVIVVLALGLVVLITGSVLASEPTRPGNAKLTAQQILAQTGFSGGLIVHLGCGDGRLTAALGTGNDFLVQGLDRGVATVIGARDYVLGTGVYGRVTVDRISGSRLPYIDNLVNLIVVEQTDEVPRQEIMRVLCPKGVACIKQGGSWVKITKPRPGDIDEWTHYLHSASNNAVAHDKVVGPPRRLQWTDGPKYSRHHDRMSSVSAVVSAGGRVLSIEDEASAISILLPANWKLSARDAFNGSMLWQRDISSWFPQLWPLKSGPAQLPRRLVAAGDRVYVTLGYDAPFAALDAADGKTVRTYAGSDGTEEAILADGILYLVVNDNLDASQYVDPKRFNKGYGAKFWDEAPRKLMAFRASTGELLWDEKHVVLPATLAANSAKVVFHNGRSVICLDRNSGQEVWRSKPIARAEEIKSFYLPILVLYEDVVLFSGGETAGGQTGSWYEEGKDTMTALALDDGAELWNAHHPPSGYRSPEDLLVVDGLVWTGETTSGRAVGQFTARDPRTGEVVKRFDPNVSTYWFHHRCYRGKATDNYLLMARTGTEFIDVKGENWITNHWIRGACLYGVMPANGLLYAPRHPCACYLEAKMSGFNALAPVATSPRIVERPNDDMRLVQGIAYDAVAGGADGDAEVASGDWPTFRHDSGRTGRADTSVPTELAPAWSTEIGGKLTSPVIADGRVFVAAIDTHMIHAMDGDSGKPLWRFQAGGRIDSPPTIYEGRVLFGSADGTVYCLRASDGALGWRFLAAPMTQQLVSFGQLESVWPVHGSVLVENGVLYCVAGRSMFVDDGMLLWRLDPRSGEVLSKTVLNEKDVDGKDLHEYVSWLNMPTALPDVLSSDGRLIYMRSQPFQLDGTRLPLQAMPRQEDADRGAPEPTQNAEHAHIFCPTGFLDDTWWHRTYWLYGSTFVSGWSGYYLSGKVAPAGRLLVADDEKVYGFGRKPKYFRWTTPIEHQLFCADKNPTPKVSPPRKGSQETKVSVAKSETLNPTNSPLTVEAWVRADRPNGVILAHGGGAQGYSLYMKAGKPTFAVRSPEGLAVVASKENAVGKWVHVAGVLTADKTIQLYVDGRPVATGESRGMITVNPQESLEVGADENSNVGDYDDRFPFTGLIDEVRIYHRSLSAKEIRSAASGAKRAVAEDPDLVIAMSFENGAASDDSGNKNVGVIEGAVIDRGKMGDGLRFVGNVSRVAGYTVVHHWTQDLPLFVRAMVLADGKLFVSGPPDLIDEEATFRQINDPRVQKQLTEQLASVAGGKGGILRVVSAQDGRSLGEYHLETPPVFDGMAAANGRLYLATIDGRLECHAGKR